eukprot:symbB.v1.2.015363.t1/scaffold1139.1/size135665/2
MPLDADVLSSAFGHAGTHLHDASVSPVSVPVLHDPVAGHAANSDVASDFLMLPGSGRKVHSQHFMSMLEWHPPRLARRLATKAVNKAAWFHDAVVDFQETEFFWQAHRFARKHVVAEAFGLGVVTGGVLLLTAPASKNEARSKVSTASSQATPTMNVRSKVSRRRALPTLPVVREEETEQTEDNSDGGGEELDDEM